MLFSSVTFLCIYLPLTLMAYYACPRRYRNWIALTASLVFYSWGAPLFVFVLIASSASDYICSKKIAAPDAPQKTRRTALYFALAANLLVLAYFKYMNFFAEQIFAVMEGMGLEQGSWTEIILPIGISFFTFQKLSYLIDVYRGVARPAASFHNYLLYVVLFPQLIAGPIVRYHHIEAQITDRSITLERILQGFWRFALGLSKKVLIANILG